ncbi:MAG: NTP transferase domain-containing protein [Rhodospirillales bacterium]
MKKIRIAIVGVGNCASSLIQGLSYYRNGDAAAYAGLMHQKIGAWSPTDIEVVAAFDIDRRKVGQPLESAIFAPPNCTVVFQSSLPVSGVTVQMGPVLDGIADHMDEYRDQEAFRVADETPVDVTQALKDSGAEVLVCYLPVGSDAAVKHYAQACLDAGVGMVNCVPVFIASDPEWAEKFEKAGIPIVGDDIKSQVGATIVHRQLTRLFGDRGVTLDRTYQLNTGGNTDFLNMLQHTRLKSKKKSKTQSVNSQLDIPMDADRIHIGPSDYVPWQKDNKIAFIRMEGRGFGNVPLDLELRLSVQDSPNSAGVVIDAIRCVKVGLERNCAGVLEAPSAYYMKSPPVQMRDSVARDLNEAFVAADAAQRQQATTAPSLRKPMSSDGPRTALILAAGEGSRLFPGASLPKPLVPVDGVPLGERVITTLREALGIERFVISVGHEAEMVQSYFRSVAKRNGLGPLTFVNTETWKLGNGASTLAAADALADENFLLTMCDHLYEPALVSTLVASPPPDRGMTLAVDSDKAGIPDLDDVMKVLLDDNRISKISKTLEHWDVADTGVMYCTPGLFDGLRTAQAMGRHGLADGLAQLATSGLATVSDVTGCWWLDVDTPTALRQAEEHVRLRMRRSA